nr:disease resistance protein TAO1-like [Ipomoea batatas]GMD01914.1 disease resistance protein TAO1-like [Ipomoea batatas]
MWVSKDMIREYLCSHEVFGSSPHNTLPVYLEEKLRLFMWIPSWCTVDYVLKCKTTGVELLSGSQGGNYEAADDLMQLSLSEYGYFTEPIKVEELEVSMVLRPLKPGLEEKATIHPYIYYEEKDGDEVYFFPMKPNVEIKFSPVRRSPSLPPSDASNSRMAYMILGSLRKGRVYRLGPGNIVKDFNSWFNFDVDGLGDHDSIGLEIPMDDLSESTGVELLSGSWRCDYKAADDLMQLSLSEYGYFTEPIKVEELEVSMVLCPLKPGLEEKVTIHPYICYQEKDDEDTFYVFPMEPNVEIKVSPVRITPLCRLVMH